MFTFNNKRMATWNPFTGCKFQCQYCWARKLAEGRLKKSYPNGFVPEFHPGRLKAHFKAGDFVFVSSMGDISFANSWDLRQIIQLIDRNPDIAFLLLTKSPNMFLNGNPWLDNICLGATIETNRPVPYSKAPATVKRYHSFAMNPHQHKLVSIEPVMDFDLEIFVAWIRDINPEIVEVGVDNYHYGLPEPPADKLRALLANLRQFVPHVIEKVGIERVLGKW